MSAMQVSVLMVVIALAFEALSGAAAEHPLIWRRLRSVAGMALATGLAIFIGNAALALEIL